MKFIRSALPHLVAIFGLVFTASAMAQYMWLDASGRKVYSDQPPPANISSKNILQQPGKAAASTAPLAKTPAAAEPPISENGKTAETKPAIGKDKDLEAAKKKIDDEAAAKKKVQQEAIDKTKTDNCARAKQAKSTLDSGMRLAQTNAKGERGFMDDASRIVETKRIEGIIASDCK